jgi:acyl-CoA thioester hydrolase
MAREDFACTLDLRVRWAEVDMQKIVFNGHYLTYIDTAIAEYWRAIGLAYPEGYVERYGNDVYLRKATLDYLGSARYDDLVSICCRVARLGRSSMTFAFEIYRKGADAPPVASADAPLVTAELVYVNADPATMKPAALPDELRQRIISFERVPPRA